MDQEINLNTLLIEVKSPEKIFFEGEVKAISSFNESGRFDVLPQHANFISIIREFLIIYDKAGAKQEIKIDRGVLKVTANKVQVFLGIETLHLTNVV